MTGRRSFEEFEAEDAGQRLRRRLEREESRRGRARRRLLTIGAAAVLLVAAVSSVVFALTGVRARPRVVPGPSSSSRPATPGPEVPATHAPITAAASPSVDATREVAAAEVRDPGPKAAAAPKPKPSPKPKPAPTTASTQRFRIGIGGVGYDPDRIVAKAGVPIEITVARGEGCAAGFAIPQLHILKDNSNGPVTFRIRSPKAGSYTYVCGMGMVTGTLVVK